MKTKDDHEYPQGISKIWRQRVMEKGDLEGVLDVAERAVLASCSLNSINGRKMTILDMDAEQRGYCSTVLKPVAGHSEPVSLYLPQ